MNDWIEIAETLQHHIADNSSETEYQKEIENCLKILGWRSSNKTMQSQVPLSIGHKNSIRPDIVLFKNGKAVLPIEIKRPCNNCNVKQENQLMSYMRQLRLNVGLYVGENIQLYYDNPGDTDNPISILKVELKVDDQNGDNICEILSYEKFDSEILEGICKERYNQIIARNNLQQRLDEFFSIDNANRNIFSLIKDKFLREGYRESVIEDELGKLSLIVEWKNSNGQTNKVNKPSISNKNNISSDNNFSFDGNEFYCKRRFVLEVIRHYVAEHPDITFDELEQQFPASIHTNALGVVRRLTTINERIIKRPDLKNRYFLKEHELITLKDGTKVAITNQWGKHFPKFLDKARSLYHITGRAESEHKASEPLKKPNLQTTDTTKKTSSKLKLHFNDGKIIMEPDAVATFKEFIEHVGIENVASLNIPGRKNTPLLSKDISAEYRKFQRPMSNGYFLLSNHSTSNIKRIIEQIASQLNLEVHVEIVPK